MEVTFYLKRPKADETVLFARISYEGEKVKFYTSEKINPKFWNKESQRAKQSDKFKEYPEFNARLDTIETSIKNIYRRYQNDHSNRIPPPEKLKELLEIHFKQKEIRKQRAHTLFAFFEYFIKQTEQGLRLHPRTGKPINKNSAKVYTTTFNHLLAYKQDKKKDIDFDTIDLEFYASYTEYLIKRVQLATNTIGKHIQVIKTIMNEATERGLNTNLTYKNKRFVTVREKSDSIYLTETEIKAIENLNLSSNPRLERVRDLFLVGCHTGLRYSDFSILKPEHIKDGFIETTQMKTNDPVVIPVHPCVQSIIDKYNGILPRSISNQKTNDFLKELGKLESKKGEKLLPSLDILVSKSITKGGIRKVIEYKKGELITTHTARRSFATNEYLAGTPSITIMAITGHKTEKAFLKYIKLTPNEHAKLLKKHWQNRASLRVA